jgi:hypothetical protein
MHTQLQHSDLFNANLHFSACLYPCNSLRPALLPLLKRTLRQGSIPHLARKTGKQK